MDIFALVLTVGGSFIALSFTIIGFFLKTLHSDVRRNTEETGKNKGRIELVESKSNLELTKLSEVTQLEIRNLSKNVSELSTNVNTLVEHLVKKK